MEEVDNMTRPDRMKCEYYPFWVQVFGLPVGLMTEHIGIVIGDSLGDVLEVDANANQISWGKYMRIRVRINVMEPLERGTSLALKDGMKIPIAFKYERLPDLCFVCGCLSHHETECDFAVEMKKANGSIQRAYGLWLCAEYKNGRPWSVWPLQPPSTELLSQRNMAHTTCLGVSSGQAFSGNDGNGKGKEVIQEYEVVNQAVTTRGITTKNYQAETTSMKANLLSSNISDLPRGYGSPKLKSDVLWSTTDGKQKMSHLAKHGSILLTHLEDIVDDTDLGETNDETFLKMAKFGTSTNEISAEAGNCLAFDCFGRSGGLALLWTENVVIELLSYSASHIDVIIRDPTIHQDVHFTGFYGNPDIGRRKESWHLLRHLKNSSILPWLCAGDFNKLLSDSEKFGGSLRPAWQLQDFEKVVKDCNFTELPVVGPCFTWRRK
ncbi:hypothetical protein REPUB_Repub03eG0175100 [Reevesia pubescens]